MNNRDGTVAGKGWHRTLLGRLFYPLSEKKVRLAHNTSLRRRLAVIFTLTIVSAISFALACDYLVHLPDRARQRAVTAELASKVNGFALQYYRAGANLLSGSSRINQVLSGATEPGNLKLQEELALARGILDVKNIFVLDRDGVVVGSGGLSAGTDLIGTSYASCPCYPDAIEGHAGRYAVAAPTPGSRDIYFSEPVRISRMPEPVGVLVIQVSMDSIDAYLRSQDRMEVLILSGKGLVVGASREDWLFKTTALLSNPGQHRDESGGHGVGGGPELLPFAAAGATLTFEDKRYLVRKVELDLPGWEIITLSPVAYPFVLVFVGEILLFCLAAFFIVSVLLAYKEELLTRELQIGRERRKKVERSRRMTQRELETILSASLVGIILVRDGFVTSVNEKMCRILGYTEQEFVGSDVRRYFGDKKTFRDFVRSYARRLARSDLEHIECFLRRKDGLLIACSLSGRALEPDDLSQGVVWVVEDIRERKQAEQELQAARDAAESASRAKSAFLANMSHEIRTPLNGIIGMAEYLLSQDREAGIRGNLELIYASGRRLMRILNDILEFSKSEVEQLELVSIPFSLRSAVHESAGNFAIQASRNGLSFDVIIDDTVPDRLVGDEIRLAQVLTNLIGNGIKFTHQGFVQVRVSCPAPEGQSRVRILFEVIDSGIGIAPSKQKVIFEAFTQADSSFTRKFGGTGLGLAISRKLVRLMGGEIRIKSEVGRGSRFWFTIPFTRDTGPERDVLPEEQLMPVSCHKGDLRGRVLLADDDDINSTLAQCLLEQAGVRVVTAANGREAVEAWRGGSFDCILMDIQMPEMDGFEAVALIRRAEKEQGGHVPIIAMTACAMDGDREKSLGAGMDDYISKPIDRVTFINLVAGYLGAGNPPAKG